MLNEAVYQFTAEMKSLNNQIIKGMEKNLEGNYYSSMDNHREILQKAKAIEILLDLI